MASIEELFDLTGRVAIVTGGASGLGFEMATGLAEAGANIVICSRKIERCKEAALHIESCGVKTLALRCDITDPTDVNAMVDSSLSTFGRIDILVNNSGMAWVGSPESLALEDWEKVLKLNVTGTFLCTQAVGRHMIQRQRGKIINIASVQGLVGRDPNIVDSIAYSTSKGAVVNFTRDLAVKWAKHNINVNAIAPGFFVTPLNRKLYERRRVEINSVIPMGRVGQPGDLKGAAVYLASDASSFVTGHILAVDGGALAW